MTTYRPNRRQFFQAGAAAAGVTALGIPAGRSATAQDGGTLRVYWHPAHAYEAYLGAVSQFEEDNPGWTVSFEQYQWPDMRTKLLADFAAGTPPDVVEGGWIQEFARAGYIQSLQPYIDRDGEEMGFPSDWVQSTVENDLVDGESFGIQNHLTTNLLFYNRALLSDAGYDEPPTTWDEFLEVAQATTEGNTFGFAPNQVASYSWPWLLQNEVRYYDPEQNIIDMNNEAAFEALQFQADLIHEHRVAPVPVASADYEGPRQLFTAGRAAMILTGPWDISPILEGGAELDWGIAQALTRKVQATEATGTSIMIPADAANPDMGWDLLKRLVALDAQLAATKEASMTMPRLSWAEDPEIQGDELIAPFAQSLPYGQEPASELDRTGKTGEIAELYNLAFEEIIYRNISASEAIPSFVEEANEILAN